MSDLYMSIPRRLRNDRFLRALKRQPVDRTPVWMMRQAGRYLPEYRASRAKAADFMALCRNPELCCEVTLQPLARYPGLDAAILFSDILTIPDAMGLGLSFREGLGPVFERTVRSRAEILDLPTPDVETELGYVMEAVRTIRAALGDKLPLIGFTGSPWTLATYMVEGRGKTEFTHAKRWAFDAPDEMDLLLDRLGAVVADYLLAQVAAGADALMIFDTWGGVLPHAPYRRHSARSMFDIVSRVKARHPEVPVILYTKGGGPQLGWLAETSGADALGTDWTVSLADARAATAGRVALQGNLDPQILLARPERVREETRRVLADYGAGPGHVFNLGHGILPQTPPEHAAAMIETVVAESGAYHRADSSTSTSNSNSGNAA